MSSNKSSGGLGIPGVLTIIFVILKVLNVAPVAAWSWLWVLSPLWISFLIGVTLVIVALLAGQAAKSAQRATYRSGPVRGSRNEREMYARMAERAQRDSVRKQPSLPYFDQRNGVR